MELGARVERLDPPEGLRVQLEHRQGCRPPDRVEPAAAAPVVEAVEVQVAVAGDRISSTAHKRLGTAAFARQLRMHVGG